MPVKMIFQKNDSNDFKYVGLWRIPSVQLKFKPIQSLPAFTSPYIQVFSVHKAPWHRAARKYFLNFRGLLCISCHDQSTVYFESDMD
jgi:hypothetical protein